MKKKYFSPDVQLDWIVLESGFLTGTNVSTTGQDLEDPEEYDPWNA